MYFLSESIIDQNLRRICRSSFRLGPSLGGSYKGLLNWYKLIPPDWVHLVGTEEVKRARVYPLPGNKGIAKRSTLVLFKCDFKPEDMLGQRLGQNITLEQWHATVQQLEPWNSMTLIVIRQKANKTNMIRTLFQQQKHAVTWARLCCQPINGIFKVIWFVQNHFLPTEEKVFKSSETTCISSVLWSRSENISIWSWLQYLATCRKKL